jgi:3-oxoacyl-[acyl-carrier protein] reductase
LQFSNTQAIHCDFKNQKSILHLCNALAEMKLNVLVNNAYNTIENKHFHKLDARAFKDNFCDNIFPIIQITQTAIAGFRKQKSGKIINVTTSFLINKPPLGLSAYVAEKAYLASLSKSWANENAAFNITSNCVAPSMMLTPFTKNIDERVIENILQSHPLKRLLTPDETADTIWLLLQAPQQINGVTLTINGGMDVI